GRWLIGDRAVVVLEEHVVGRDRLVGADDLDLLVLVVDLGVELLVVPFHAFWSRGGLGRRRAATSERRRGWRATHGCLAVRGLDGPPGGDELAILLVLRVVLLDLDGEHLLHPGREVLA